MSALRIRLIHCLTGCVGLTLLTRLHLAGSGNEEELYCYFLPALLGGALGVGIAALRLAFSRKEVEIQRIQDLLDSELKINEGLLKNLTDMRRSHELILDSIDDGVYRVAHDGNTTFINQAVLSSTGFNEEQLLREDHHLLLHHSQRDGSPYPLESCPIHKTCQDGKIRRVEGEVFWRKDGSSFPVDYIVTPTNEVNGTYGAAIIFRDISSNALIQEHLAESKKQLQTLFDTSSEAILNLDKQGRITKANPATFHIFGCQNEKHLLGKSLMDFFPTRQTDNHLSTMPLAKLLAETLQNGFSFSELKLHREDRLEIEGAVLLTRIDRGNTTWILANIRDISVQKKNTHQFQEIQNDVESRGRERAASLEENVSKLEEKIPAYETGTASGEETDLAKTSFMTSIANEIQTPSQSIINLCKQMPVAEKLAEKGSLFSFDIPFTVSEHQLLTDKEKEKTTAERSTERLLRGYTLLLADDEFINRRMFASILENQGAVVHCVEDGNEALRVLEKKNFDCILMDVQMPNCNGFDAMQAIRLHEARQQRPRTPAIALTAHALSDCKKLCYEAGMDTFLSKPVDANILVHSVCELISPGSFTRYAVSASRT
ncbi:MAG: response regulator [Proteobacteria bacterium]|nr:response regulator [Pseudomonadota bacterium]MBU1058411.1 response regulator [Pseudomonadota bacterium]